MDCNCPTSTVLSEIPAVDCAFDMKQIQRLAFVIAGNVTWGQATSIPTADADIKLLADWDARKTAVDNTKIVFTPLIGGDPAIAAGDAVSTGGGDNSTLNGVKEITGTNPSEFTATFKSITPEQELALKQFMCQPNVEVYFFLEGGRIASYKIAGTPAGNKGFRIQSYFFSDRGNSGFGTKDMFSMSFNLGAGWSENLTMDVPTDFNPLYDL